MTADHSQPDMADSISSNAQTTGNESVHETARSTCPTWWLMAVVGTVAFTLAAAHAPAPMRKLFVFSIVCGLLLAEGYAFLQRVTDCQMRASRFLAISCGLILASQIGVTLETHRQYREAILKSVPVDSKQAQFANAMPLSANEEKTANDKLNSETVEQKKLHAEFKESLNKAIRDQVAIRREQASLTAYLQRRIKPLGDWPLTLAWVIWMSELALAALAGGYAIWRRIRPTVERETAEIPANSEQSSNRS